MGSLKRIKTASLTELMEVKGIGPENWPEMIVDFFHPGQYMTSA